MSVGEVWDNTSQLCFRFICTILYVLFLLRFVYVIRDYFIVPAVFPSGVLYELCIPFHFIIRHLTQSKNLVIKMTIWKQVAYIFRIQISGYSITNVWDRSSSKPALCFSIFETSAKIHLRWEYLRNTALSHVLPLCRNMKSNRAHVAGSSHGQLNSSV